MAAAGHEERQMDEQAMKPHRRSLKAAGPGQGATQRWGRDSDMDRHAMQGEVGYLFSGL